MRNSGKRDAVVGCITGMTLGLLMAGAMALWIDYDRAQWSNDRPAEAWGVVTKTEVVRVATSYSTSGGEPETEPRYHTDAQFQHSGKTFDAHGVTDCGWCVPATGQAVRILYSPRDPASGRIIHHPVNEHFGQLFGICAGLGVAAIALVSGVYQVTRKAERGHAKSP